MKYVYFGMLLVAMILLYYAFKSYKTSADLVSSGHKTKAKVIDMIAVSADRGYTYKPVFEFVDKNNKTITFESKISSKPAPYELGEQVTILYDPYGDVRKIVSFWGLYRWSIILLCFASPFLIIGGGYFLYTVG